MKKIIVLLLAIFMLVPTFASANTNVEEPQNKKEGLLTAQELEEINAALDKIVVKANENLDNGIEDFVVKEKIGKDTIEFGFESTNVPAILGYKSTNLNTSISTYATAASTRKLYRASVKNTAGWNFEHILAGEFTYSGGKINGATTDVLMTGAMYTESHRTWIDKLDPSVWVVQSHGTFKALKYLVEYNTYLTVRLLGSGHYRVERAQISF
ncbi:hypothetical protein CU633_00475 [Bacillus sp. V3-13]|uniref:hypothetical protein n=1 Tax=Bacillus sp. V3-13 TaxID=2053728 RepID=UPI000C76AC7C|nr:hypothetical protein [Bacillus sp. V3-13]PLR79247.1 hypothetical protein CU633_00475 [Bacillus sp. V3-13]